MHDKDLISVVVPFYNEAGTVEELHSRLVSALAPLGRPFELVFVDDRSTDGTFEKMRGLSPLRAVRLRKNSGQSAALNAGFRFARGTVIVAMDSDLENLPEDVPTLLAKLDEGYDVVSGWRRGRWPNKLFSRRLPSVLANKLISAAAGVSLHDHGCTLKAYRREVLERLRVKGEEHRLIAANAALSGARVAEIAVGYAPRRYGKSKYGLLRIFKVLLDVLAMVFWHKYASRPMHFFGGIGFMSFALSLISFFGMLYFKLALDTSFILTPLPVLTAIFFIVGCQFVLMGLIAELIMRRSAEPENSFLIGEELINN